MVLCRALCAAAAVVTTISATATGSYAPPDHANFTIPSYDLSSPHDHAGLVQSLQTHGIVALRSVPAFAESRAAYVQAAYTCMRDHPTLEALLHKQLQDGTERTTISTHADGSVGGYSAVLDVHCPQLSLTHKSYGDVLHSASLQLARVLSETVESPPSSLLDAVVRGAHLDHVHRYTSPSSKSSFPATAAASSVMSLDFHTDNGLFLLTSAPFYFDATDGHAVADAPSGLVLQLSLDGVPTQVRPRLVHDELVVMVGEGYTRWGSYGHSFPAVLHAMQMPLAATAVRMFAGRMLLLPKDATLAHTNLTFQAYAEASTRYRL
ncbi:hypothetical protein DYB34_012280 [Aphanomyces astaci]|uniref:Fe2OG dioxygenase domain-containing protein n=1 Tax=Aphanomyces astaci TaxID=112090 RepID=A0A3R6YL68_APHAT|nr:hypothetical protein DYB34_012280 [Aphanomyces astaci]